MPVWRQGVVTSFALDGIVESGSEATLTIFLSLQIRFADGHRQALKLSLYEPGITSVELHRGGIIDGMRPIISIVTETNAPAPASLGRAPPVLP